MQLSRKLDAVVARLERRLGLFCDAYNKLAEDHNGLVRSHESLVADFGLLARLLKLKAQWAGRNWFDRWQRQKPGRN